MGPDTTSEAEERARVASMGANNEGTVAEISEELERRVVEYYEGTLLRHGPTSRGMDWKDETSQRLRFAILCEVCGLDGLSVHEVGAGVGHLADFLDEQGINAEYSGSDLSAAMVAQARRRHPQRRFERHTILSSESTLLYDIVLCSGVFHVRLDVEEDIWWDYLCSMLLRMYGLCRTALAFNLMRDDVDYRSARLYYPSSNRVLEFCRTQLSRHVTVRRDYPLFEQTIYVYRDAPGRDS